MINKEKKASGVQAYSGLEGGNLLIGEGVSLGNDGNQVDLGVQALHDLDVQRLQRVAGGLDEEDAGVDAVVNDVHAVDLVLSIEVGIETLLNVIDNGSPRLVIVDKVAKARGIDDGQAKTDPRLLDIGADRLDTDGLGDDVEARALALLGRVQGGVEQSVDKSRLSEAGFTCGKRLRLKLTCSVPCRMNMKNKEGSSPTTMTLKLKPFRTLLRCHWLGRLAKPTYPVSFLRTMFLLSGAAA